MEEELDLMEMFKYFWRKKIWIILVGIICVLLAVVYTKFLITPTYTATSSFILTNDDFETEADVYLYAKLPDRYYAIANSVNVLNQVVENLKLDGFESVNDILKFKEKNIIITHSPADFSINVSVTTDNAKKSADIANEIVRVSIEEIKKIYKDEKLQIIDYAIENGEPVNIELKSNVVKFVLIGEILVCGYILILYMFVEPIKKEKLKELEEKEKISKEFKAKEQEVVATINKTKKYIQFVKERKELEKNLKDGEYKKVLKLNDEILKYYAAEAYMAGYMDAKKNKEKSVEE